MLVADTDAATSRRYTFSLQSGTNLLFLQAADLPTRDEWLGYLNAVLEPLHASELLRAALVEEVRHPSAAPVEALASTRTEGPAAAAAATAASDGASTTIREVSAVEHEMVDDPECAVAAEASAASSARCR